jgi:hypothetical protein
LLMPRLIGPPFANGSAPAYKNRNKHKDMPLQ